MRVERCGYILETITLNKLLSYIQVPCSDERCILGISDDSRKVKKDWLFLCRKGAYQDGASFAQEAFEKGAVILWEDEEKEHHYHCNSMRQAMPILLNIFYQDPSRYVTLIGVTGTNGKTSVATIIKQLLEAHGKSVMMIGTNHIHFEQQDISIDNTTPSSCMLASYLSLARAHEILYVVMEVSSHAIDQERIGFLKFDCILYTNITKDHLDYHITRTHYQYTKFKLRWYLKRHGILVLNQDFQYMHDLYELSDAKIVTFGKSQAHYHIEDVQLSASGTTFTVMNDQYTTSLLGMFNVYNIIEAIIVMRYLQIPYHALISYVHQLQCVAGRMEVHVVHGYYVWIDYAHTQSALMELLKLASQLSTARVITIVGCGGNRDRSKRPLMAETALKYSDIVIFTSDNPRYEEPYHILYEMIQGQEGRFEIFENRLYAIKYAMKIATNNDIIVIAGKGDENYQLIKGIKYTFSDRECVSIFSKLEGNRI